MTADEIELLWRNPQNWRMYGIYSCPQDPRIIVPKRIRGMGWTMNFVHKLAWPLLGGILVLFLGPFFLLKYLHLLGWAYVLLVPEIILLWAFCSRMASAQRYADKDR